MTLDTLLSQLKGLSIGVSVTGPVGNNLLVADVLSKLFRSRIKWKNHLDVTLCGIHTEASTCVIRIVQGWLDQRIEVPISEIELITLELPDDTE